MVTGDHPATAAAIATETGLRHADDPVLLGHDLPDDEQVLGAVLDRDGIVVARVSQRTSCGSPEPCAPVVTSWR